MVVTKSKPASKNTQPVADLVPRKDVMEATRGAHCIQEFCTRLRGLKVKCRAVGDKIEMTVKQTATLDASDKASPERQAILWLLGMGQELHETAGALEYVVAATPRE